MEKRIIELKNNVESFYSPDFKILLDQYHKFVDDQLTITTTNDVQEGPRTKTGPNFLNQ